MRTHALAAFAPFLLPGPAALKTSFSSGDRITLASPIDIDDMDESDLGGSLEELGLDLASFKPFADNVRYPEASAVSTDSKPDCWMPCGRQSGRCGFCGAGNACCRKAFHIVVPECNGVAYSQDSYHECVAIVEQAEAPGLRPADAQLSKQAEEGLRPADARPVEQAEVPGLTPAEAQLLKQAEEGLRPADARLVEQAEELVADVLEKTAGHSGEEHLASELAHEYHLQDVPEFVFQQGAQKHEPAKPAIEDVPEVDQVDRTNPSKDEPEVYQVDRAIYRSVGHPMLARDVTGLVNDLLKANGPRNVTGAMDLNPVFGDVAPHESKVLRISVGRRWRDMKEAGFGGPLNKTYDISKLFQGTQGSLEPPSIFIAVFSRRGAATRRGLVREMWSHVARSSPNVDVKFALCDVMDAYAEDLQEEHQRFNDLLLLPCDEGYGEGLLTRKVLAAMTYYRSVSSRYEFFMKVDDDTFIAWERFYPFLLRGARPMSYIGVPIDAAIPCRNASYRWYEPYSTFNATYFPKGMAGGPGYAFGNQLVEEILGTGVGHGNVLWNEDRAAGVWVDKLIRAGRHVEFLDVPGIDGWWRWDWRHPTSNWATWADYPYMLHHGLHGESIQCLALADQAADPWRNISHCFAVEAGEEHTPFECARQTEAELAKLTAP